MHFTYEAHPFFYERDTSWPRRRLLAPRVLVLGALRLGTIALFLRFCRWLVDRSGDPTALDHLAAIVTAILRPRAARQVAEILRAANGRDARHEHKSSGQNKPELVAVDGETCAASSEPG